MFWCLAPFLIAMLTVFPYLVDEPTEIKGLLVLSAVELLCLYTLFGLYNPVRYRWCLRVVGGIIFLLYLAYLVSMISTGEWFGGGRRARTSAINALFGLISFGYLGFMYAVLGRFSWRPELDHDSDGESV